MLVKVSFNLKVGELIDSSIMQLYPLTFAKDLISSLMNTGNAEEETTPQPDVTYEQPKEPVTPEPRIEPQQQQQQPPKRQGTPKKAAPVQVSPVEFSAFDPNEASQAPIHNLDMLLDIPLSITVELGRTKRSVKEILELSAGSIIELDKLAGSR